MWCNAIVDRCSTHTIELRSSKSVVLGLEYATAEDAGLAMGRWEATFGDKATRAPALLTDPNDVLAVVQLCWRCLGLSTDRVPKSTSIYAMASRSATTSITVSTVLPTGDFKPLKRLHSSIAENDSAPI